MLLLTLYLYMFSLFLCVFYTRELAIQISEQFEALGSSIGVKCGMSFCSSVSFLNQFSIDVSI